MLTNRDTLEKTLSLITRDIGSNKKNIVIISKKFSERGLFPSDAKDIFAERTPLPTLSLTMLCLWNVLIHEIAPEDSKSRIDPSKFFTDLEIQKAKNYREENKNESSKYPIVFEKCKQLNTDQWYTDLTAQELVDLYNRRVIIYNPETQRESKTKQYKDKIITSISTNKTSIVEIKKLLLNGEFMSNFITLNLLEDGSEVYDINEYGKMEIQAGELNIIDGFHRSLAIIDALNENQKLEFKIGVIITHYSIEKAQRYIVQEDKRNKINTKYIKSLNVDNKNSIVVKKINESYKSNFKGKITTDNVKIKSGAALIKFDVLFEAISIVFNVKENYDIIKISNYLIDGLNIISENKLELLKTTVDDRIWIMYLIILSEVYERDNWELDLSRILKDIEGVKLNSIQYTRINKALVSRIKNHMESRRPSIFDIISKKGVV